MRSELLTVLESLLDGVILLDAEGDVEQLNAEASRILELSSDQATGRSVEELLGPGHALAVLARRSLETGRAAVRREQRVERRDEDFSVDVAASPLVQPGGGFDGVVVVLRDRTIQSTLQEAVAERERLDLFGRIAAGIAHEVKNPLGGIRGAGEILAARAADDKTREAAELIVRETRRISKLLEDFMVLARGDELRLAPINVHEVLDEVLGVLAMDPASEGIEFKRSYDPSIPELEADRDRLSQIFLNLGRNALQAMPVGGRLELRTRMMLDHRLATARGATGPTVAVDVKDTGPGIQPDEMERVVAPFFTTRSEGTGLGLPIADHWVTRHGGRLVLRSKPGEGLRARVLLPLRRHS